MATPALTIHDWNDSGPRETGVHGADRCGNCAEFRAELAKTNQQLARAHLLLRVIARTEPRPAKPEMADDAAECLIVGYAQAFAGIRARIELFLKGRP